MVIDVVRPVETSRDVRRASGSFRSVLRSSRLAREREGRRRVTRRWTDGLMMMIDADRHQSINPINPTRRRPRPRERTSRAPRANGWTRLD